MRASVATSSIHSVTAMPCSCASCRARRQLTPASPKLSTTRQKMSQRSEGAMGAWDRRGSAPLSPMWGRFPGTGASTVRRTPQPACLRADGEAAFIHSGRHRKKGLVVLEPFTIDVVSDVVCPWCYIGKRRLEAALARLREAEPDLPVAVRWHPFQLNPDLPREGVDRRGYLEAKFGGPARAQEIYARVQRGRRDRGHPVRVRRDRAPAQHARRSPPDRVGAVAARRRPRRAGRAAVPRVLRRRAVPGRPRGAGVACAADAGYDADDARAFLASDELADAIAGADERARALGVSGVPFFVFGGKTALSGAHEPEALLDAIAQARAAG